LKVVVELGKTTVIRAAAPVACEEAGMLVLCALPPLFDEHAVTRRKSITAVSVLITDLHYIRENPPAPSL
jgi:hypothetical protein